MQASALSSTTVVVRSNGLVDAEIDQEIVALSVAKGVCYGLDPIGSRIWKMLANPIRVADICQTLVREYEVAPETCESDVLDLLEELRSEGMIEQPAAGADQDIKGQT
jgi:hypothetical protein